MRWIGTTQVHIQYGGMGVDLPQGAKVLAVTNSDTLITLHFLADMGANYSTHDVLVTTASAMVPLDMEFIGVCQRNDGAAFYVFHRE